MERKPRRDADDGSPVGSERHNGLRSQPSDGRGLRYLIVAGSCVLGGAAIVVSIGASFAACDEPSRTCNKTLAGLQVLIALLGIVPLSLFVMCLLNEVKRWTRVWFCITLTTYVAWIVMNNAVSPW